MPWGDSSFGDSNGYGDGSGLFTYVNSNKDFYRISNFDYTNLSSAINQKTMLIDVDDISVFPPPPFAAVIDKEIIKVINSTGNTLITQRAMENTLPAAHVSGSFITSIFTENVIHSVCDKFRNYDDIIYDTGTSTLKIQNADDLSLYYKKWETVTETGAVSLNLNYPTVTDNQINDFYVSLTGTYYSNAVATSYARNASGLSSVTQSIKDGIKVYDNNKYIGSYQNRNQLATSKLLKVLGTKSLATVDLKDFEYISVSEDATDSVQDELTIKAMSASYEGHEIVLFNDSETKSMRILHNGYGSLTGATIDENILTPYPYGCLVIDPKGAMKLIYDGAKQSWRTLINMYYYRNKTFKTMNVANYGYKNSSPPPNGSSPTTQFLNLYTKDALDYFNVWEWYVGDKWKYGTDILNFFIKCWPNGSIQITTKKEYALQYDAYDETGEIRSDEWSFVYDPDSVCKKYKETEVGQYPNEKAFIKLVQSQNNYNFSNWYSYPCGYNNVKNYYWIYWWVQSDNTVKIKRAGDYSFCDYPCASYYYCVNCPNGLPSQIYDCEFNTNPYLTGTQRSGYGGTCTYLQKYYSHESNRCQNSGECKPTTTTTTTTGGPTTTTTTTTAGPTTTTVAPTTTTTTVAPTYYYCMYCMESNSYGCVGPYLDGNLNGTTTMFYCNLSGPFASLSACESFPCQPTTTTTTTAAPTTTTTAAPTATTTAAPITTTAAPRCAGMICTYYKNLFVDYAVWTRWDFYSTCYSPDFSCSCPYLPVGPIIGSGTTQFLEYIETNCVSL